MMQLSRLASDRDGAVAITTALAMTMILGFTALAIDVGSFYLHKREQQTATDLAALVAAADLGNARSAASATLADNGINSSALQTVELGTYTADTSVAAGNRFQPGGTGTPNAVRLTVRSTAPMIFGSSFLVSAASAATPAVQATNAAAASVAIKTVAIGAQANFASFAIGSRLASLNNGLLNSLFSSLLGGSVSLSLVDYQALASANIDVFAFTQALATRANLTTVTYGRLASASVRVGDVLLSLRDAAQTTGQPSAAVSALAQLAAAKTGSYDTMLIASLIGYGPFAGMPISATAPITASVSALDMLMAAAEIAGQNTLVSIPLSLNIPGIASATLQLAVGSRPAGTSFVGMGTTGVSVHTAQTRLLVTVALTGTAPLTTVSLPIYLEVASGTATLTSLQCGPSATAPALTLVVTPSLADAWIGSLSNASFLALGATPSVQPATLASILNLVTVTGIAHATIANTTATAVTFSSAAIAAHTKQTTSTNDFITPLLVSLDTNLQTTVQLGPFSLLSPTALQQSVAQTIAHATTPVDQLLSQVLQTLGLGVGEADTWVTGVHCGGGVLVN